MATYLTFLLDLSNETRLLETTLRFVPDPARMPPGPSIWKVTCDANGDVFVRSIEDDKLVLRAIARWSGRLTDKSERLEVSDKQWDRISLALEAASARRRLDPRPYDNSLVEREDGVPLLPVRSFLLDVNAGIVDGTVREIDDDALVPTRATEWKVTCLPRGQVTLHTLEAGMVVVLATATWDGNALSHKRIATGQVAASQWKLVTDSLREAMLVTAAPVRAPKETDAGLSFELDIDGDTEGDLAVTCDEFGLVTVRAIDGRTAATARWDGTKLDGKLISKGQVSAMQWNDIAAELRAAKLASVMRALDTDGDYMTFLLDMTVDAPVPVLVDVSTKLSPLAPTTWKVRMDRAGTIAVVALVEGALSVVATAQWDDGKLEAKNVKKGPISTDQWARLRAAIPIATTQFEATRAAVVDAVRPAVVLTPYVTFLLHLADGDDDRIVEGSLSFVPDRDRQSTDHFHWKVTSDAKGTVWIWGPNRSLVGTARWNGSLIDRERTSPAVPTDHQWLLVEQALVIAFERRAQDPTPIDWSLVEESQVAPAEPRDAPTAYRAFLYDLRSGERIDEPLFAPDSRVVPGYVFVWKVIVDGPSVEIYDRFMDRLASATWDGDAFTQQTQSGTSVTDEHWRNLRREIARAVAIPAPAATSPPAYGPAPKKKRPYALGLGIVAAMGAVLIAVGVYRLTREPDHTVTPPPAPPAPTATLPPPPPAKPMAPMTKEERVAASLDLTTATSVAGAQPAMLAYYPVRWSEVDVASQTTIEQVEKEPAEETGKRLCVEGELDSITRNDLAGRKHYTGALTTAQGDRVAIVVSGSSGTLVKRQHARICGVVIGATDGAATVYGMFDLPENRNPVVEKP